MSMFCNQCEQAAKNTGCNVAGVCGKPPVTSALLDVLTYQLQGIGWLGHRLKQNNWRNEHADRFVVEALFTTVTNVNFDDARIFSLIQSAQKIKSDLMDNLERSQAFPPAVHYVPDQNMSTLERNARLNGLTAASPENDADSLRQMLLYGLRGMAAYVDHALILGKSDPAVFAFVYKALAALNDKSAEIDSLLALALECGTVNIRAMELLDAGHTESFGHPEPVSVSTGSKAGPAIVITGHDLADLEALLRQTENTGVHIYTHGEMLPAHGYPGLRKYAHLAGHFGTAWQNQQQEFDGAPAAFVFTTNCIQKPRDSYKDQVFTLGLVGWPGVKHVKNRDFSEVIRKAKALGGFRETSGGSLKTGFGHNAVLGVADKVIDAVKSGDIRHFFLVGGCDGAKPGRNYYTKLVEQTPKDTVVLTLACGKFRFNHLDLGDIGGIPRLMDVGQCNDAHSAVKIARALADAFGVGLNGLPLSLILSWYEQKAVVILLSLLALGIKNIRLGPSLPAFITPGVLDVLVKTYAIRSITTPEEDLEAILN